MDDLHFGFTSSAHACIMIYVHELKIKLLKSKFECFPVFQLWQILVPWNSDEFLSRLPSELQSWFVHTPKSLEFPLRLFSPICVRFVQECLLIKFFASKNRTFVLFTVFKDNVALATEVQEIQPGEIYIFRDKLNVNSSLFCLNC